MKVNWANAAKDFLKPAAVILGVYLTISHFTKKQSDELIEIGRRQEQLLNDSDSLMNLHVELHSLSMKKDSLMNLAIDSLRGEILKLERESRIVSRKINLYKQTIRENDIELPNPWEE